MLLREQMFTNPLVVIGGCITWIPLCIWILALVHWMVMGDIEFVPGLLGIALGLAVGYVALNPPAPYVPGLALAGSVGTLILFPFARAALTHREIKSMEAEQVEKAYQALALKPNNPGPLFRIARIAFDRGFVAQAVALTEPVMGQLSKQHFPDEHREHRRWRETLAVAPPRELPCVECGNSVPPNMLHCTQCGSPVILDHVRGRFVGRALGRKLLAVWLAMVAVIVGLPVLGTLPVMIALPLGLVVMGLVIYSLVRAFLPEPSRA